MVAFLSSGRVRCWHIASFRCDAEFGRHRGKADIDQAASIKLDYEYARLSSATEPPRCCNLIPQT